VRVYESKGLKARVTIKFGFTVKKVQEVDLLERPCGFSKGESRGIGPIDLKGSQFDFKIAPYEIRTFRIKL